MSARRRREDNSDKRVVAGRAGGPETQRLVLVVHGARADNPLLRRAVDRVRARGHEIEVRVTWEGGDARRFAREAAREKPTAVVAVGGDGTVNEVVNGLAGTDVPLGIVPLGTANDFARQARIPEGVEAALGAILRLEPARIDLASLNGRRFLNVSTGGIGALVTSEANPATKAALGPVAYALSGVRTFARLRPFEAKFSAPGFRFEGPFLVFAVGNARRTGGGTNITPTASVTDGLLDICIVEHMPRMEFARLVLQLRRGDHVEMPGVHYAKLPRLLIEPVRKVPANVDGEFAEYERMDYRAHRLELLAFLPRVPDLWRR